MTLQVVEQIDARGTMRVLASEEFKNMVYLAILDYDRHVG